jgi:fatty-acyl-CoA synthase
MIYDSPGTASDAYVRSSRELVIEELTLGDLLRKIAAEVPHRKALILLKDPVTGTQRSWTYAQLLTASEAMAYQLLQKFSPGEHITLWSSNRPEWLFVQFGAALAGLVLVAVSPAASPRDLSYVLKQ